MALEGEAESQVPPDVVLTAAENDSDPPPAFETEIRQVLATEQDLTPRLAERARAYAGRPRPGAARTAEPRVLIHRDESPTAVILEVRAPDDLGLLYRVARTIATAGLDIRHAKISTLGHEVIDTFYVVDAVSGARPADALLDDLETALMRALRGWGA